MMFSSPSLLIPTIYVDVRRKLKVMVNVGRPVYFSLEIRNWQLLSILGIRTTNFTFASHEGSRFPAFSDAKPRPNPVCIAHY